MIAKNLHAALVGLRDGSSSRTLWIDGIYIKQVDDDERDEQLKQMKEIYENALAVILWLGSAGVASERLYTWNLLENKWWTRIWVVQEMVVARKLEIQSSPHKIP